MKNQELTLTVFDQKTITAGTIATFDIHGMAEARLQFLIEPDWQKNGYQHRINELLEHTTFHAKIVSSTPQPIRTHVISVSSFVRAGQPGIHATLSFPKPWLKRYWSTLCLLYKGLWEAHMFPLRISCLMWVFAPWAAKRLTQTHIEQQNGSYEITAEYQGRQSNPVTIIIEDTKQDEE